MRLFCSYAHKDERLRDELNTHLKILVRRGVVSTWHDREIQIGEKWGEKIDDNLERADIILLLVSADFIASDYPWDKVMKRALERNSEGSGIADCIWPTPGLKQTFRLGGLSDLHTPLPR